MTNLLPERGDPDARGSAPKSTCHFHVGNVPSAHAA
jgi:hypothetical protein